MLNKIKKWWVTPINSRTLTVEEIKGWTLLFTLGVGVICLLLLVFAST